MDFSKLSKIKDETQRVSALYTMFHEEERLSRSKAARVEYLTTMRYIKRYLKPGSKILDLGAGAGEYSLALAAEGYSVTSVELAQANVDAFRRKIEPDMDIQLIHGTALDLSFAKEDTYDLVLVMGPLYHLENEEDRKKCLEEAKRVCKPEGALFFAFISNDMVIMTEFCYRPAFFVENSYDHDTFKVEDFPFVFFTVDQAREMLESQGIAIVSAIASDGFSELLEDKINQMDEAGYYQYLKYHLYCCEKPELLGASNHVLYIGRKRE